MLGLCHCPRLCPRSSTPTQPFLRLFFLRPIFLYIYRFEAPGTYSFEVPCPKSRSTATLRVELTDIHGQVLVDEFALSFHLHFHKLLKYMVALPPVLMALALVLATLGREREDGEGRGREGSLPQFASNGDANKRS